MTRAVLVLATLLGSVLPVAAAVDRVPFTEPVQPGVIVIRTGERKI